jgi:hypothetical protein
MTKETMEFTGHYAVERLVTDVPINDSFVHEAAIAIARELIGSGCLLHHTDYDMVKDQHREVVQLLVAKRKRKLP